MAGETLSLKCSCGYIKHDVIRLGVWQDSEQTLLNTVVDYFWLMVMME